MMRKARHSLFPVREWGWAPATPMHRGRADWVARHGGDGFVSCALCFCVQETFDPPCATAEAMLVRAERTRMGILPCIVNALVLCNHLRAK